MRPTPFAIALTVGETMEILCALQFAHQQETLDPEREREIREIKARLINAMFRIKPEEI